MENDMKCGNKNTGEACGQDCRCNCAPGECKCDAGQPCAGCESSCKAAD